MGNTPGPVVVLGGTGQLGQALRLELGGVRVNTVSRGPADIAAIAWEGRLRDFDLQGLPRSRRPSKGWIRVRPSPLSTRWASSKAVWTSSTGTISAP